MLFKNVTLEAKVSHGFDPIPEGLHDFQIKSAEAHVSVPKAEAKKDYTKGFDIILKGTVGNKDYSILLPLAYQYPRTFKEYEAEEDQAKRNVQEYVCSILEQLDTEIYNDFCRGQYEDYQDLLDCSVESINCCTNKTIKIYADPQMDPASGMIAINEYGKAKMNYIVNLEEIDRLTK